MKSIGIIFVIAITFCLSCTSQFTSATNIENSKPRLKYTQKEKWNLMVGKWFGFQPTKDGGQRKWLAERNPNGTYVITFRSYEKDGSYRESVEVGEWGISGSIYFTIFKARVIGAELYPVDPTDPYNRDAYNIVSLNKKRFEYISSDNGQHYVTEKVGQEFSLDGK